LPPVRAIAFDLDGTLVDSREDIVRATNHALVAHGRPARAADEIAGFVGDGARALLSRASGLGPGDPVLEQLLTTFLGYYTEHALDFTRLMPGAREALDALGFLPLALCTNKPRITTEAVLAGLHIAERFQVVVGGGDLPRNKPDPLPLIFIAEKLGIEPAELVMVGDGPQDIECGRAAGARTVGVLGGIADRKQLLRARPDAVIGSLSELADLVGRYATSE
jgi:2-phosphoglycolate phosphatase